MRNQSLLSTFLLLVTPSKISCPLALSPPRYHARPTAMRSQLPFSANCSAPSRRFVATAFESPFSMSAVNDGPLSFLPCANPTWAKAPVTKQVTPKTTMAKRFIGSSVLDCTRVQQILAFASVVPPHQDLYCAAQRL